MADALVDQLSRQAWVEQDANPLCDQLVRQAWIRLACAQPPTTGNFNYIKSFARDDGRLYTYALDATGILWREDVNNSPNVLDSYDKLILPNTYAKSVTELDEEWIAFSDLLAGTDIPLHGSNLDRISQVGPGAGPSVVGSSAGSNVYTIVAAATGLTQPAIVNGPFDDINWADGPTGRSAGNVLTIFYTQIINPQDQNLVTAAATGGSVYLNLTSAPFIGLTGTYVVTSVGQAFPSGSAGAARWYFTVTVAQTGNTLVGGGTPTGSYRVTLATMKTTTPADIQIGDKATIAGAGIAGWNSTWTILGTPNGAQISVTATSLTTNVATYTYTLVSGSAVAVGNQVTITGCTNGPIVNGTSIFNVSKFQVATAGVGTFTLQLNGANVVSAAESGTGIANGTIFTFDPGLSLLGAGVVAIIGNSGGGTVTTAGALGGGVRSAVTIFITRNGYVTAPSPPVVFETTGGTDTLNVTQIAVGPPNVIGRIVALTGANGGNFFYIPVPVTIQGTGQPTTYSSTVINDNSTTVASFRLVDAVLLAGIAIDVQGNNLFNQIELGSAAFSIAYADRMFYGLENNKIQNLLNPTFDGGYLPNQNGVIFPLGWTPYLPYDTGGTLVTSQIFGNSYRITNSTGSQQTLLGMIYQSAFQDVYKVPIILPNFTYSVRMRARCPNGVPSGIYVDLLSSSFGSIVGQFSVSAADLTTNLKLFTGTLLTSAFTGQVPQDLLLRVYAGNVPNLAQVEIDRIEIFPTAQPVLNAELQGSYVRNLEAFDGLTGPLGLASENNQTALGAFVNYDILYILKSSSMFSTQDSPGNEPANWTVREVSNKVGTAGINAYDVGEEWMLTACRSGLYVFAGGEPVKCSQEIQPTWDAINWQYGYSIWLRNDIINRKILIGVPMVTPNQWLPNAPVNANPTTPNVILMCNYKELNTSNELATRGPIKIQSSGRVISWDMARKWSIWQIPCPYADFITRGDGNAPLFFCNGNGDSTISQQIAGLLNDNGEAINSLYTTYGFVKSDEEAQNPLLGNHRKAYRYTDMNVSGSGRITMRALPNTLDADHPVIVPGGLRLADPAQNNLERPLNVSANRLFLQFEAEEDDAGFQLSEVILTAIKEPHSPVRGI